MFGGLNLRKIGIAVISAGIAALPIGAAIVIVSYIK